MPREEQAVIATPAMGPAARDYDLLRGGADLLDLAMVAARASAAARRVSEGGSLDDDDRRSLNAVIELLEAAVNVVEFFGHEGQAGLPPSGALAARVDVAIGAIMHDAPAPGDPTAVTETLQKLVAQVRGLMVNQPQDRAAELTAFFAELSSSVLRETGHVGETTSIL
jgi:hypothetical protein